MTWTSETSATVYHRLADETGAVLAIVTVHEAGSSVEWVSARVFAPEAWDSFVTLEAAA